MEEKATRPIVVALAGNPNSGKTTVFNALTGARQHVANYPGVTVEKKEGVRPYQGRILRIVDLPGTYSLTAYSLEELVARDFLLEEKPAVVVDVVDASNLERNLYLTTMFLELGVPVVLALNMMDEVEARGKKIDVPLLERLLGVRAVPMVARRGEGIEELLAAIVATAEAEREVLERPRLYYGPELESHIQPLAQEIESRGLAGDLPARWLAIKLLENDGQIRERFLAVGAEGEAVLRQAEAARRHLEEIIGDDPEVVFADRRYGFISGACREAVTQLPLPRVDWSERVDAIVAHRLLGLPIFLLLMWAMFEIVFRLGSPAMGWLEDFFGWLAAYLQGQLPEGRLRSLVVEGIIGGVGGVLVFVPNILLLFLVISFLEDSGYMARAAFVVDRIMHLAGLHGRSFISMLLGFGCSVPAVLSTRVLASPRERLITMLVVPLISCGARLPVYVLLAGTFFPPAWAGKIILGIYALGLLLALLLARLFSRFLLPGEEQPFVMELPPYRLPTLKGTLVHMWERGWAYLQKAGTTILAMSVCMWFLLSHPTLPANETLTATEQKRAAIESSYAGRLGRMIEPVLRPLGFDYRIATALIAGFAAKEIVVSTLGTIYAIGEDTEGEAGRGALRRALRADPMFNPAVALALMIFVALYIPCASTIAVIYKESGAWRWPAFAIVYTSALAWIVSFIVYQLARVWL